MKALMTRACTADVPPMLIGRVTRQRRRMAAIAAVVVLAGTGALTSGCSSASQSTSKSAPSNRDVSGKVVCADFGRYAGSISDPQTMKGDPNALFAKLVSAGTSTSNGTLASEVDALRKASATGLGMNFGPAMANLKGTCQGMGFPVA